MKRLLSILGSISLVSFVSSSIVSCKKNSNKLINIVFTWGGKKVDKIYFSSDNKELTVNYNMNVNILEWIDKMKNDYICDPIINRQEHTITFKLRNGIENFKEEQEFTFKGINSNEKVISISYNNNNNLENINIKDKWGHIEIKDNVSNGIKEEKFETSYSNKINDLRCQNLSDYENLINVNINNNNQKITISLNKSNFINKEIPKKITLNFYATNALAPEKIEISIIDDRKEIKFENKEFLIIDGTKNKTIIGYNPEIKDLHLCDNKANSELKDKLEVKPIDNNVSIIIKDKDYFLEKIDHDISLEFTASNAKKNEIIKFKIDDKREEMKFTIKYLDPELSKDHEDKTKIKLPYYNNEQELKKEKTDFQYAILKINKRNKNNLDIDIDQIKKINNLMRLNLIDILKEDDNDDSIILKITIIKKNLTKEEVREINNGQLEIFDKEKIFKTIKLGIEVKDKRYQKNDWLSTKKINFNIVENYNDDIFKGKCANGYLVVITNNEFLDVVEKSKSFSDKYPTMIDGEEVLYNDNGKIIKFKHLFSVMPLGKRRIYDPKEENHMYNNDVGQTEDKNFNPNDKVNAIKIGLRPTSEIENTENEIKEKVKEIREKIKSKSFKINISLKINSIYAIPNNPDLRINFTAGR